MESCLECNSIENLKSEYGYSICQKCYAALVLLEQNSIRKISKPEPADLIIDNIYLGSELSAINSAYLESLSITRVLVTASYCKKHIEEAGIEYMVLEIDDDPSVNIVQHFPAAFNFIVSAPQNVLVHCVSGISRSAAIVIAYIINTYRMAYDEAFHLVKAKRKCVHPNSGFKKQLKAFAKAKCSKNHDK